MLLARAKYSLKTVIVDQKNQKMMRALFGYITPSMSTVWVLYPTPTLPALSRRAVGPQGRPVAPPTRTGLLLRRGISDLSASHQQAVHIR